MSHAEICPVCKGNGWRIVEINRDGTATVSQTCHGCGGTGWVTVLDDPDDYVNPRVTEWHYPPTNANLCMDKLIIEGR